MSAHVSADYDAADVALALRILSPGDDDKATLGELRREYGISVIPSAEGEAS